MIRILLVDDHTAFRDAFALILERHPEFEVIGEAATLADARQWFKSIDVALIGLPLADDATSSLFREIRTANPKAVAVALSASTDRKDAAIAVEAGAAVVLPRTVALDTLIETLMIASAGEALSTPQETIELLRLAAEVREAGINTARTLNKLTPREMEVLQVLAEGLSDREIGRRLNISAETVHTHFVNILEKLNVRTRIQALIFAIRNGVAEIPRK